MFGEGPALRNYQCLLPVPDDDLYDFQWVDYVGPDWGSLLGAFLLELDAARGGLCRHWRYGAMRVETDC